MNIIYTTSRAAAERIIKVIAYANDGVTHLGTDYLSVITEKEEWHWLNPNLPIRGYRAEKAIIDTKCSEEQIQEVILPQCFHCKSLLYLDL